MSISTIENKAFSQKKYMVLGVSFNWGKRKGLDVFCKLAVMLPEEYQIVLVGVNKAIKHMLPSNILSVEKTQNQNELIKYYTAADVFVNPTREENYPTVNMEALSCGTPVITFNTGGSPEIIDQTCGSVVNCEDIEKLLFEIQRVCEEKPYPTEACLSKAQSFNQNSRFKEYVKLYK